VPLIDINEPLGGREAELTVLAELIVALDWTERALMLQVAGEPGIGKSRLLAELAAQAAARGHLVLSGRAAEFEAEHPFGVFGDALDDWLLGRDRDRLEALAAGLAAELAIVFPAFGALTSARAPELQQEERYRAYRAVRGLLSALAQDVPVVLVLDDMQWADPGSVELISHLLVHPCQGRVLVALGFRPAQVSAQLSVALAAARRDQGARRLDLAPLTPAAAGDLLGPEVSPQVNERLYRESGGNPFFLLQLARGATLAGRRSVAGGAGGSKVPDTVRAALASELSSVSAPALVLLQGAAVCGDPFDGLLAAGAAGVGAGDALDLIDELLQFQLVRPTSVGGQFAFRHPIVRSTVYELAAGGWRARAHARVAAMLAGNATAVAQAPHVERSAEHGDGDAIAVLVAAAASSARRTPALAARWHAAALALLPETADTECQRIELLVALATARAGSGRLDQSRDTLCELLDRLPAEHPIRVPIVAACAGVEHLLGRHRDAHSRLTRAYRAERDTGSLSAVLLQMELAAGAAFENRHEEMLTRAEQTLEGATKLGQSALEVAASGQIALARYFLGLPAFEAMDRAAAGLDALSDGELATRLDIGLWVGWTESVLERHERAVDHCQRVIDVARATGQGATLLTTMTAQAWSLIRMGRLDDADETLKAATEAGYLAPHIFLSVAVGLSSLLATHRGDFEAAARAGEESVRLAREADPGLIPGMSGLYMASPLIETGQARRAREIVLEMSGGGDLRTSRSGHAAAYEVLTRAELGLGNIRAAQHWADKAEAATHGWQLGAEAAFACRALAAVALARGDAAESARLAMDGAGRAEGAGAPVEAGRCRILAARALVQSGRRADAIAELNGAAEQLGRVGAHGYRAQAERALLHLGARPRRGTRVTPARDDGIRSLTDREREVAELVRRGHTNREIATTIFVSEKTVERHLSRIFAKLGVSRRTEVAVQVAAEVDAVGKSPAIAVKSKRG
jgi:DNA-binding CsgD family transcriptional regulator/tetratricopeptide (TPR) repeat protein